jgi:hypothetical protein
MPRRSLTTPLHWSSCVRVRFSGAPLMSAATLRSMAEWSRRLYRLRP